MTNEKAKEIGKRLALHYTGQEAEAMETLLKANEIQIPHKPDVVLMGTGYRIEQCPTCKGVSLGIVCHTCGQAIDWSKE